VTTAPIGFHRFHRKRFINYQLNRLHSLGFVETSEIYEVAKRIAGPGDYVREFDALVRSAESDGRLAAAAFYARGAEFFTPPTSPDRLRRYDRFIDLFDAAFVDQPMTKELVP
jgi:hypothetical protein